MKDKLTKEQSSHLIELGVSADKASEKEGDGIILVDGIECYRTRVPVFTLTDLLELLPIADRNLGGIYHAFDVERGKWAVGYEDNKESPFRADELIDALYELLCWTIE